MTGAVHVSGQDSISNDDLERFRLRRFVETLSAAGELTDAGLDRRAEALA